ncbi:MAG: hypothetical protein KGL48_17615 [Sphingomonadales bacterium]|nr:hypothetical protein [Sphingomonadales bacterium]MDE2568121.1 hypothetical protein [Sphingomonadales bacterium]
MQFTVSSNFEDYKAANWLFFRKTWLSFAMLRNISIIFIIAFLAFTVPEWCNCGYSKAIMLWGLHSAFNVTAFGFVAMASIVMLSIATNSRRVYERQGIIDRNSEYVFDSDGMEVHCETGLFRLKWRHLNRYILGKTLLVIRWNFMVFIIPFDQLEPGVATELADLLSRSGLKRQ